MASARKRKNFIHSLFDQGDQIEGKGDSREAIVHFFESLYKPPQRVFPIPSLISFKELQEDQALILDSHFEEA